MAEHNELVNVAENQGNPYDAKASEFSVAHVSARNGQSEDGGGKDMLVKQSKTQEGARHAQDGVSEANDSMDENASAVAANFKVERNKGESSSMATSPDLRVSVDFRDGDADCSGYKKTRVGEVPGLTVHIG